MKIITFLGTRPEIIRLSRIIPKLDKLCEHTLIHTGQNYDKNLSDIFFKELNIREPNVYLGAKGSFGKQIGMIIEKSEQVLRANRPDKVLVLGDTNSDLSAYVAERLLIPVYHMEAGNRCWDKRCPEEVNRRLIDHISSMNFPYTPGSRENLIREGLNKTKIIVTGNPIYEVMQYYRHDIKASWILNHLGLHKNEYFLATFHRQETVDIEKRLWEIRNGLEGISIKYNLPVICSIHPRTRDKLKKWKIKSNKFLKFLEPFGFFDFIKLEQNAKCILTDSGTVQEEACILRVPCVIMRDSTERPETIEVGATIVSRVNAYNILKCTEIMLSQPLNWQMPIGYTDSNVSNKMIKHLLGE